MKKSISKSKPRNQPWLKKKEPWPTKKIMEQVYEKHLWGGADHDFYSGDGSHEDYLVEPYVLTVNTFLKGLDEPPAILDLGCGDFNVGQQLLPYCKSYHAVDIVEPLIERNKKKFIDEKLTFSCLDIVEDEWPPADVIILRHVLQHLSNAEILKICAKLPNYQFLILTEHEPTTWYAHNKDIEPGQGIRLKKDSGVQIGSKPFYVKFKEQMQICKLYPKVYKGKISTYVYHL